MTSFEARLSLLVTMEENVYFYAFSINLIIGTWLYYIGIEKQNLHFYYPISIWQVAIAKLSVYICEKQHKLQWHSYEIKSLRAETVSQ